MKELQTIIKESERILNAGGRAVLATVVDVKGSSYRLPGAKMLIAETGETFGTVSGGCLEADVLEHAAQVLKSGRPIVLTYDTTKNENSVFSLNMGCNGIVRVLLEPVQKDFNLIQFWQSCFDKKQRGAVATLIATNDANSQKIGLIRFLLEEKQTHVLISGVYPRNLVDDCFKAIDENLSRCQIYETAEGADEFFIEVIKPPLSLVVFGAGHDAVPLVELAKNLGWRVSIVDHRAAFAAPERFPNADEIILSRPEKMRENVLIDENTAAVVMTHNYERDREIIGFLLNSTANYIGALGPKRRTESLLQELRETGNGFTAAQLAKLHGPVGLDIGANSPETIALSIIAEIQSVTANRTGGFLRNREGSIYNRSEQ